MVSPSGAARQSVDLVQYTSEIHPLIGRAVQRTLNLQASNDPETTWRPILDEVYQLVNLYRGAFAGHALHPNARRQVAVHSTRLQKALMKGGQP